MVSPGQIYGWACDLMLLLGEGGDISPGEGGLIRLLRWIYFLSYKAVLLDKYSPCSKLESIFNLIFSFVFENEQLTGTWKNTVLPIFVFKWV